MLLVSLQSAGHHFAVSAVTQPGDGPLGHDNRSGD